VLRRIHPNSANLFHGRSPLSEIYNDLILAHSMPLGAVHTNRRSVTRQESRIFPNGAYAASSSKDTNYSVDECSYHCNAGKSNGRADNLKYVHNPSDTRTEPG
jgi:hypothetical protein